MAYNGFGMTYPQTYYPQPPTGYPQQNNQMSGMGQGTTQQNNFIPVPSEEVARNYPVAPGNSVSFKDENAPYIYVKTMGYSQLDTPTFEKFRLVREDASEAAQPKKEIDLSGYVQKDEFNALKRQVEELRSDNGPTRRILDE